MGQLDLSAFFTRQKMNIFEEQYITLAAVLLFELSGKQAVDGWRGSATIEFEARAQKKDRLRYQMDWSITPKDGKPPVLSKQVKYFGSKLKTKAVTVEVATPENTIKK